MNYLFWLDRPAETYRRFIEDARSFDDALNRYIRKLPIDVDVIDIKFEQTDEVIG